MTREDLLRIYIGDLLEVTKDSFIDSRYYGNKRNSLNNSKTLMSLHITDNKLEIQYPYPDCHKKYDD